MCGGPDRESLFSRGRRRPAPGRGGARLRAPSPRFRLVLCSHDGRRRRGRVDNPDAPPPIPSTRPMPERDGKPGTTRAPNRDRDHPVKHSSWFPLLFFCFLSPSFFFIFFPSESYRRKGRTAAAARATAPQLTAAAPHRPSPSSSEGKWEPSLRPPPAGAPTAGCPTDLRLGTGGSPSPSPRSLRGAYGVLPSLPRRSGLALPHGPASHRFPTAFLPLHKACVRPAPVPPRDPLQNKHRSSRGPSPPTTASISWPGRGRSRSTR